MAEILKTIVSFITSFVCMLSSFAFGDFDAPVAPEDANSCKASFAAISDLHMFDDFEKQVLLEMGLDDMQNASSRLDALVLCGDNTNNARAIQYENLYASFSKYDPADNILMAMGNHDTWNTEVDPDNRYPESERLFFEYTEKISGRTLETPYFSTVIKGYTFIVMASEGETTDGTISDNQLRWLNVELLKATKDGKPAFVISHFPLDDGHGLPNVWYSDPLSKTDEELKATPGGYADGRSAEVESILKQYNNVFFITGHLHNGLADHYYTSNYNYSTIESEGSFHSINLPSYGNTAGRGTPSSGVGVVFEVYEDQVLVKGRCFTAGVWYTENFYTIPIV